MVNVSLTAEQVRKIEEARDACLEEDRTFARTYVKDQATRVALRAGAHACQLVLNGAIVNSVLVTLTVEEQRALIAMLEHEHFSYTDEGQVALAAFKKIRDAVIDDAVVDVGEAMLRDGFEPRVSDETPIGITLREDDAAKVLLRDLEWSGHIWDVVRSDLIDGVCPSCRKPSTKTFQQMWTDQAKRFGPAGHAVDCKLRALMV